MKFIVKPLFLPGLFLGVDLAFFTTKFVKDVGVDAVEHARVSRIIPQALVKLLLRGMVLFKNGREVIAGAIP